MEVIIKDIPNYEGLYKLDSNGILYKNGGRFTKGRKGNNADGYLSFVLEKEGIKKWFSASRLIYTVFVGPIPEGYVIHHKDHNNQNNRIDNLVMMTEKEHILLHIKEHKYEELNKK